MRYLIDTHTFLWYCSGAPELSFTARKLMDDKTNSLVISIASLWEISIKSALGKLTIEGTYELVMEDVIENDIEILPINFAHTVVQNKLPLHHRDPFDRMIASQAISENLDLISRDSVFDTYFHSGKVKRLW